MNDLYPWQASLWQILSTRLTTGNLPHAMLFAGLPGLGQYSFAKLLAASVVCSNRTSEAKACGECRSCILYLSDNHPDFSLISPIEEGKAITVDQIRETMHYANLTPQYAKHKLLLVSPADKMNIQAANSFLKTLEEPASQLIIILLSERPSHLLATIRSRCQTFLFKTPSPKESLPWLRSKCSASDEELQMALQFSSDAPLLALDLIEKNRLAIWQDSVNVLQQLLSGTDPIKIAASWVKEARERLWWLQRIVVKIIRMKLFDSNELGVKSLQQLHQMANPLDLRSIYFFWDHLVDAHRAIDKQANVQLLMEKVLIHWCEIRRC